MNTNMEGVQDVGDHMAEKELPKYSNIVNSSILDSFSALDSNVERCRVSAGVALLRELSDKHHENEDDSLSTEVSYTLKRLIRGLGGNKTTKRAGCFSVLVGILTTFPGISIKALLEIVRKEVRASKSSTKSEQTGAYISQALVCGALIRSGVLLKASNEEQQAALTDLINVWKKKKDYLSFVITSFFKDLIDKIDKDHFKDILWPVLKPELSKSWKEHTLDTLYLLLIVREKYPEVVKKKFLVEHLDSKVIIHDETLPACSELLMKTSFLLCQNHPIIEEICKNVAKAQIEVPFWESLVNEFQKRPRNNSEEGLLKFLDCLVQNLCNKHKIPEFLNETYMEQAVKTLQARGTRGGLSLMVKQNFVKMCDFLKDDGIEDETRIDFLKRILHYPGNVTFDKLAGTKIVSVLSSCMKMGGVKHVASILKDVISAEKPKITKSSGETHFWNNWERIFALHQFTRLLSLPVVQEHQKWKVKQTIFLLSIGLFAPSPDDPASKQLVLTGESRNVIFKVLDQRAPSLDRLRSFLNSLVHQLHDLLFNSEDPAKLREPLTESSKAAWHKMMAVVDELESSLGEIVSKKSEKHMFHVLFLYMGLHIFQNASLAEEMLSELHCCYERTLRKDNETKEKKKDKILKNDSVDDDEPFWIEVVVDLFLSLLSRNSHLLRNVVTIVFPYLCPHLTQGALHQILQVLDPFAKKPLADAEAGEDEDSDDSENESETVTEDTEKPESGTENMEEDKESDMSEDEDLDDDLDDMGNEPVNVHLKMAVQKALSLVGGGDSDQESVDMDDMTEEECRKLNEALSNAFKLLGHTQAGGRKNKKQSKDDETLMNFRIRVLDLLDCYFHNKPELEKLLYVMLCLFDTLEFCIRDHHQAPLEGKVRQCLKRLCSIKQLGSTAAVSQSLMADMLQRVLQKGERVAAVFQNMWEPLVQGATFLARTAHHLAQAAGDVSATAPVQDVFMDALNTFFKKRDSLLPLEVFKAVLLLPWEGAWKLAPALTEFAFDFEMRPFRRLQALKLLISFYSNIRLLLQMSEGNKEKLFKLEEILSTQAVKVLSSDDESRNASCKDKYMVELLALLLAVRKAHSTLNSKGIAGNVHWDAVLSAFIQYGESTKLTKAVKTAFHALSRAFKISIDVGKNIQKPSETTSVGESDEEEVKEEKNDEVDGESEDGNEDVKVILENGVNDHDSEADDNSENLGLAKKIKKKKRQKQKAKNRAVLKKQSEEARAAAMAEGLDDVCFSAVNVVDVQDVEVEERKGKKRKVKLDESVDAGVDSTIQENVIDKKKLHIKENGIRNTKKKKHSVTE